MLIKSSFMFISFTTLIISLIVPWTLSATFTISNNCPFTIWPGTLSGSGTPPLSSTGFQLDSGKTVRLQAIPGWSGRLWARTGCKFDATGIGTCVTGDCGGRLECDGNGAAPPTSLFEITLGQGENKDFYDVSLVDGYNLPLVAWPVGASGCNATGCAYDINMGCPKELQVVGSDVGDGGVVACKSACEAFGLEQYCCSGQFANPTTCRPSYYSSVFKRACPRAYSYAFDDGTSTFTCKAHNYAIVFCPTAGDRIKRPDGDTNSSPPSSISNPPPSSTYNPPPSNMYNPPPSNMYNPPPSSMYNPPPISINTSPPVDGSTIPSSTYTSPPIDGSTTPIFTYNSPPGSNYYNSPTIRKHSYGASEGEISSSYPTVPCPACILLIFSLLLLNQIT